MGKWPEDVIFLNPRTCGIYKNGGTRFKTDPNTGKRTDQVDNELIEDVTALLAGSLAAGSSVISVESLWAKKVMVPTYYDHRYQEPIETLCATHGLEGVTIGELVREGILTVRGGHGSPGNDQRSGSIPYVKVSDIRGLRVNVNPTNLVTESVARRFWKSSRSGLEAWDLITPNRASSNIGEFAILLPGEERVVLTKEMFVFRVVESTLYDPFYLLWAMSLRAVREQWRRITLMQTNREDCGGRYREVIVPRPPNREWAIERSEQFRKYFATIAAAKQSFVDGVQKDVFEHVANVATAVPETGEVDVSINATSAPKQHRIRVRSAPSKVTVVID